jgi:GNAT superfamily N-acetyltransferase
MEGADEEALVAVIRQHSDEAHAEQGIADAAIRDLVARQARMTVWDGQPRRLAGPPEVRALTPERLDDYLGFFDRDAFMDNPIWASCYCMAYHVPDSEDWQARTAEQNRADKAALIVRGEAHGVLAYDGERVIGWCHAAPRARLPSLAALAQPGEPETVGAIACFVIAAPYRRQGVAARLLDAACDRLRELGMTEVQAGPPKKPISDARAYHGPLSLYLNAGFERIYETDDIVVVRKSLVG